MPTTQKTVNNPLVSSETNSCEEQNKEYKSKLPIFLQNEKVFITRLRSNCKKGSDTYLTVMGVPCQGRDGYFSLKGYLSKPKMVSFSLDVGCPSSSYSPEILQEKLENRLSIANLKLLAINPLEVKYWEIPSLNETGMGDHIEFRTNRSLALFKSMREGDSLDVILYGRENSWGRNRTIYKMNAKIKLSNASQKKFSLEVIDGKQLKLPEVDKVKDRCKSNRYKIPCLLGQLNSPVAPLKDHSLF